MNFRQLDCFLAVADCLSFSAAANKLFLSQSAVSQQIASLEQELGFPLFERSKHKVKLTAAGSFLHPRLIEIRSSLDTAFDRASNIAQNAQVKLTLGYDGPLAEPWVGKALSLAARSKGRSYDLRRASMTELTGLLIDGSIDFVITTNFEMGSIEGISFHPLITRTACVFVPPGHPLSNSSSITLEDLEGETLIAAYEAGAAKILSKTGNYLIEKGISIKSALSFPDGDTAFLAVQSGEGIFVASHLCDEFARQRFGVPPVDLDAGLPDVTMGVAWKNDDPAIDDFIEAARTVLDA